MPVVDTASLDQRLLEEAERLTGITDRATLIHEGLRVLIARESAKRLARLGGTEPHLERTPRRQP
jgi:hypothetical protein